jgi:hypothetical protein
MDQPTQLPHLVDLNKQASIDELKNDYDLLSKYAQAYNTFDDALYAIHQLIQKIEKE